MCKTRHADEGLTETAARGPRQHGAGAAWASFDAPRPHGPLSYGATRGDGCLPSTVDSASMSATT